MNFNLNSMKMKTVKTILLHLWQLPQHLIALLLKKNDLPEFIKHRMYTIIVYCRTVGARVLASGNTYSMIVIIYGMKL